MARLRPFFPKSHCKPRVHDRRFLSGISLINRNGLRCSEPQKEYGPAITLYNRWERWGDMGVFARMMEESASEATVPKMVMIDATYLKAYRTASSLRLKRGTRSPDWLNQGGMNTKLHAVTDENGRTISFFMSAGEASNYTGAAALLNSLPPAQCLLADRGYDADWFCEGLHNKSTKACILGQKSRPKPVIFDRHRYKRRNRNEIMFSRLKDWRRVAIPYDRCNKVFLSTIALAATVLFWL